MVIYYTNQFGNKKGESRALLARAIAEYTGEDASSYMDRMEIGELGKPLIEGLEFSVSHSENMWGVLFDDAPCGLDIQHHRKNDMMKIAERWYHPDEVAALGKLSGQEQVELFYKIWTRREALVKTLGKSIIDSNLPNTMVDEVSYGGLVRKFQDFTLTGADNMSVAFCVKEVDEMNIVWLGGCDA